MVAMTGVLPPAVGMKYVIKVYEQARGKGPSSQELAELKEGINLVHDELEAREAL